MKITILVEPRTKKNSSQIIYNQTTRRRMIIPSKLYLKYLKETKAFFEMYRLTFPRIIDIPIDYPVNIKAIYYVKTQHRHDLPNLNAALHDALVACKVIKDDDSTIIESTDGSRVKYDKDMPRTEVEITRINQS